MSSASVMQVAAFNKHLLGVLDMLKRRFPEDRDISFTHSQIDTASRLTPRLTVVHFVKEVLPFSKQIDEKDELFFLQMVKTDLDDVLGHLNLNHKWSCLSDSDRKYLWKNIQNLTKLGKKILCL